MRLLLGWRLPQWPAAPSQQISFITAAPSNHRFGERARSLGIRSSDADCLFNFCLPSRCCHAQLAGESGVQLLHFPASVRLFFCCRQVRSIKPLSEVTLVVGVYRAGGTSDLPALTVVLRRAFQPACAAIALSKTSCLIIAKFLPAYLFVATGDTTGKGTPFQRSPLGERGQGISDRDDIRRSRV